MSKVNKKIIFPLTIILLFILFLLFPIKKNIIDVSSKDVELDSLGKLSSDDIIKQEFIAKKNYNSIGVDYANYSQSISGGTLKMIITDQTTNKTETIKKKLEDLVDNKSVFFKYKFKKNHSYSIEICHDSDKNISFYSINDNDKNTKLYINDEFVDSDLLLRLCYIKNDYSFIWYFAVIILIYLVYLTLSVGEKR